MWYGRSLRQEGNSAKQYTTLKDDQISGGRDDIVSDVGGSKDHSAGEISDMGGGGMGGDNTMDTNQPQPYTVFRPHIPPSHVSMGWNRKILRCSRIQREQHLVEAVYVEIR